MSWTMTNKEKRYDKQATGVFKQKYGKESKFKHKSKKERQQWWADLTDDEREAYIVKKNKEKANRPARPSNCPVYGPWNDTNRHKWRKKVLKLNPWLPDDIFDDNLDEHDSNHLQSITHELRTA